MEIATYLLLFFSGFITFVVATPLLVFVLAILCVGAVQFISFTAQLLFGFLILGIHLLMGIAVLVVDLITTVFNNIAKRANKAE